MSRLGQAPKPAEHGSFLQQQSVAGRRVEFVQNSDTGIGTITLQATGHAGDEDFGYVQVNLTIKEPPEIGSLVSWFDLVAWNYIDFYVDSVSQDPAYIWRQGSSLSRGQMNIEMNFYDQIEASSASLSHTTLYFFKNDDSSSHTVTAVATWKFVETSGAVFE